MTNIFRLAVMLMLLPLLAACLADGDDNSATMPTPEATVAEPSATPAAAMASATATDEPADATAGSQATPATEAQETPTTPAQHQVLRFDATPTPEPAPTTVPAEGIPYELIGTIGEPIIPQAPSDIDILEDGNIVVADAGRSEIQIFSPTGELRSSWPTRGFRPWDDSFRSGSPEQVVAGHGSYFVGISQFSGIALYGDGGDLQAQFVFNHPSTTLFDLTLGPDGRIFAAVGSFRTGQPDDADPFGVYVFDANLNLVEIWESSRQLIPMAIAFDEADLLHSLVVRGNAGSSGANLSQPARFVVLDPGDYDPSAWDDPVEFELEGRFDGLAITSDGDYILIEEASNDPRDGNSTTVHITTQDGEVIDRWDIEGHTASQVRTAAGMIVTADDRLILADTISQRILTLELDGGDRLGMAG